MKKIKALLQCEHKIKEKFMLSQRPKIELHRHLELSMPHSLLKELAKEHGFNVEKEEDFQKHFLITKPMTNLSTVLNRFLDTQKLFSSEEILQKVGFSVCQHAFTQENIRLLELRYCPTFIQHGHGHSGFEAIHQAILQGVEQAQKQYPELGVGLLITVQRILSVESAESVVDFAIENKDTILGLDLADNEAGHPPKPFAKAFQRAKKEGLRITIHAGESHIKEAPFYVKDAVEHLGAERIGHGIQIARNQEILNWVKERQIPLEACLTSNYLTQAFETYKSHPFKKLLNDGVKMTINTDDPSIFCTDMNTEYDRLRKYQDFTEEDFQQCERNAFEACFIKNKDKFWKTNVNL